MKYFVNGFFSTLSIFVSTGEVKEELKKSHNGRWEYLCDFEGAKRSDNTRSGLVRASNAEKCSNTPCPMGLRR
jgi:hypothetical protein